MQSINKKALLLVNFGLTDILSYAAKLSDVVSRELNLFHEQKKALALVKDKFVYNIRFAQDNQLLRIEARVKAEMKTKVSYPVSVDILSDNTVQDCRCACPGGASPGSCKHVFAVLHALEEYSRLRMYAAPTERLQAWHQPTKVKLSPKKSSEVYKKTLSKSYSGIDICPLFTGSKVRQLMSVLTTVADVTLKLTPPLPACIVTSNPPTVLDQLPTDAAEFVKKRLIFNLEDIWELEQMTITQSQSSLWKKERKWRLTASNFYKVCVRRNDFVQLASSLLSSHLNDLSNIPAIAYGNKYESLVRLQIRTAYPDSFVREVGLVTHPAMPHLAASPDGLIHDSTNTMLLEIKCSFNVKRLELEELAERSNFCLVKTSGKWELKRSHSYYYQVQGQLALSNLTECVFALFYKPPNHVFTEVIPFDRNFWLDMYAKLNEFYLHFYLPAIMSTESEPAESEE